MEIWKPIPEFPRYSVSNEGRIRNERTERIMRLSMNQYDVLTVGMMHCGTQFRRSVPLIVAQEFVPGGTEFFDTPICMDWDRWNVRANNLCWRPNWFAVLYNRQIKRPYFAPIRRPIRNAKTGEEFPDSREASKWYGVLEEDLVDSIHLRTFVWPLFQQFEII